MPCRKWQDQSFEPFARAQPHEVSFHFYFSGRSRLGDLLGPFSTAPPGFKFLIIVIDTSTKWMEMVRMTNRAVVSFFDGHIFA